MDDVYGLNYTDKDIHRYIESYKNNEIMFNCDEYYLIDNRYNSEIKEFVNGTYGYDNLSDRKNAANFQNWILLDDQNIKFYLHFLVTNHRFSSYDFKSMNLMKEIKDKKNIKYVTNNIFNKIEKSINRKNNENTTKYEKKIMLGEPVEMPIVFVDNDYYLINNIYPLYAARNLKVKKIKAIFIDMDKMI